MQDWTRAGKRRTARAYIPYTNAPLPTPEDRRLFILRSLKVAALQVAPGALFGLSQSKAHTWIHVLLPVLHQTLVDLYEVPARHRQALEPRLADLAATTPEAPVSAPGASSSPVDTRAPNDPSRAPKTPMSQARVIAARKSGIR
jgi:hypothetical protein